MLLFEKSVTARGRGTDSTSWYIPGHLSGSPEALFQTQRLAARAGAAAVVSEVSERPRSLTHAGPLLVWPCPVSLQATVSRQAPPADHFRPSCAL